jgi:SagB-type dehydrogenase family enzyme
MTVRSAAARGALLLLAAALIGGCAAGGDGPDDGPSPPASSPATPSPPVSSPRADAAAVPLPEPRPSGPVSLEEAIAARRSVRDFAAEPVTLEQAAQLLWAAQGVTDPASGHRSAPSAGALYPLEVYLVAARVDGLAAGVYRYVPAGHQLLPAGAAADPAALARAALAQDFIARAPVVLVITAVPERTAAKYGERARRYVDMEAGHAAQNVYLQAAALGLGTVTVGAFDDAAVSEFLGLGAGEEPLYLMPVGRPR